MSFRYSPDWYENVYHAAKKEDPSYKPPEIGDHPDRDLACLTAARLRPEHEVLILGCGGGNNLVQLAKIYPEVKKITAIDFAPSAVRYCKFHFPYIRAEVADCSDLPFDDDSFDRVLCMDLTEHLPFDLYLFTLFESRRVLRQGGKLILLPGMTRRPEHINLLPLKVIEFHLVKMRFRIEQNNGIWIIAVKP